MLPTVADYAAPVTPHPSRRVLLLQRSCAPEHAGVVRQLAAHGDRAVLPRWHQDDRGLDNAHRGVHEQAPPGAYVGIQAWGGRAHWLAVTVPVAIAIHRDVLRAEQVSPATFRLWASVESNYAQDQRTGRRCVVRPSTVASVMGMHVDVAKTCRRVARKLGLQVVVLMGRMLNLEESTGARRRGSRQRGLSTETALTIPDAVRGSLRSVDSATPTRGRARPHKTPGRFLFPRGLAADKKEAPPAPPAPMVAARALARALTREIPWLASERPRRITPAVTRFAHAPVPWSATDLRLALEDLILRRDRGPIRTDRIRTRPAVLLAALLREINEHTDHPEIHSPTPLEHLRCNRPDCDHGWIPADHRQELIHQLLGTGPAPVRRCPDCQPGAWPIQEDVGGAWHLDEEPPF